MAKKSKRCEWTSAEGRSQKEDPSGKHRPIIEALRRGYAAEGI